MDIINHGSPEEKNAELLKFFMLVNEIMGGPATSIRVEAVDSPYTAMAAGNEITINSSRIPNFDYIIGYGLELFVHESVHILQNIYVENNNNHASSLLQWAKSTYIGVSTDASSYHRNLRESEAYGSSAYMNGISFLWSNIFNSK